MGMIQQITKLSSFFRWKKESPKELHWGPVPGGRQFLGTGCTAEGVKCSCGVLCELVLKVLVIYVGLHINVDII